MVQSTKPCPKCGQEIPVYRNPVPTVDVIIEIAEKGVVLIQRNNPPYGWALPGGFVDYGESYDQAAIREAKEETGLEVRLKALLGVYSSPDRDPRQHTASTVFVAQAARMENLQGGDDAGRAEVFPEGRWPELAFDHLQILNDYRQWKEQQDQLGEVSPGRAVGLRRQKTEDR